MKSGLSHLVELKSASRHLLRAKPFAWYGQSVTVSNPGDVAGQKRPYLSSAGHSGTTLLFTTSTLMLSSLGSPLPFTWHVYVADFCGREGRGSEPVGRRVADSAIPGCR